MLGVVLVVALLPSSWLAPWTTRVSELTYLPLVPLGDVGTRARYALRSGTESIPTASQIDQIVEERNEYRRRLHAAAARIAELEDQVLALSQLPEAEAGIERRVIHANIVGRSSDRLGGPVRLNAGSRRGVVQGAIAVHNGDALVGRVLERPGPMSSFLVPIGAAAGLIDGILDVDGEAILLQLESTGEGFLSSVPRHVNVQPGNIVRLHDAAWPRSAQGMRVAEVVAIRPRSSNPNRLELLLKSVVDLNELSRVLIVVEDGGQESAP